MKKIKQKILGCEPQPRELRMIDYFNFQVGSDIYELKSKVYFIFNFNSALQGLWLTDL